MLLASCIPTFISSPAPVTTGPGGTAVLSAAAVLTICPADFNHVGTADLVDDDAFVVRFEGGSCPPGATTDFDGDGSVDFFDDDAFVVASEGGC